MKKKKERIIPSEDAEIVVLCQYRDGSWDKMETPYFLDKDDAENWVQKKIIKGDFFEDNDYFIARQIPLDDTKTYMKKVLLSSPYKNQKS